MSANLRPCLHTAAACTLPRKLLPLLLLLLQIHKIMAGLLDQHQLAGHPQALPMVEKMAQYFCSRQVGQSVGTCRWGLRGACECA